MEYPQFADAGANHALSRAVASLGLSARRRFRKVGNSAVWLSLTGVGVVWHNHAMIFRNRAMILEKHAMILQKYAMIFQKHGMNF